MVSCESSPLIPHYEALELFLALTGDSDEADSKAGGALTGGVGSPDDLAGSLDKPSTVGDAEEEAEPRARIESVVSAKEHSGSRDVDGLIESPL